MTKNSIYELSIQVNLNGLSFCILNRSLQRFELLEHDNFEKQLNPIQTLEALKNKLRSLHLKDYDFNTVQVIHQNDLATLVPEDLYEPNNKADYLKFNSKILQTDFIAEDKLAVNKSVNVYIPYVNINNYIFELFGEFVYKHASTILINELLQTNFKNDNPTVVINVNPSSFELLVVENRKLLLYNTYEYNSKEDFIYYILFVYEQLKLNPEEVPVKFCGNIAKDDDFYDIVYTYIRHVDFLTYRSHLNYKSILPETESYKHFLILNSF